MKRIITISISILTAFTAMANVSVSGPQNGITAKEMVSRSVCGLEFAPESRLWASTVCSVDGQSSFIALSYSDNAGKSWTDCANIVRSEGKSVSCGTLWCAPDGALWLFFTENASPVFDGKGTLYVSACSKPADAKPLWSEPREIGYGAVSDKALVTKDGIWVLPYSLWGRRMIDSAEKENCFSDLDVRRGAGVYTSADKGKTWNRAEGIVTPASNAPGRNDASLILTPEGALKMVVRGSDNVLTCEATEYISSNLGASWSKPAKFIDNPDRRLNVTRLPDGRLLMVKNAYFDQLCYIRPYNLVCYLSDDNGATWYGEMRIASDSKSSNPYAVCDKGGNIFIAYDNNGDNPSEVLLLKTDAKAIESVYGNIQHEDVPGKAILKASRSAAFAANRLKEIFAPRKDWADKTLRIGTYNIQYENKQWKDKRLPALEKLLAEYKFDIFGSQEPYDSQIADMDNMDFNGQRFGDVYDHIGRQVDNDPNSKRTHYNPIFYRKDRIELIEWGLEWFTDCPGKAGYGAYSCRQCCWGHFRDRQTGKEFFCFNSHPDHLGQESREQSSVILVNAVKRISKGLPSFLSGDFNADEESPSYNILMNCGFLDDSLFAAYAPVNAEYFSMSHYKSMDTVKKSGKHIDHIFYTPHASKILSWELITHSYNEYFGSDHLPIICEWKIAN